jgi:hypothetical protein
MILIERVDMSVSGLMDWCASFDSMLVMMIDTASLFEQIRCI